MGVELADITKTGLGSLVALIMSLVTALLIQSGLIAPNQLASASAQHLAHNVAQFVHCLAQGKGGSGFMSLLRIQGPALHALQSGRVAAAYG
jgi:phosphomevalonate kinase